MQKHYDSVMSV